MFEWNMLYSVLHVHALWMHQGISTLEVSLRETDIDVELSRAILFGF